MRTLVWFRGKDLRLHDHTPLASAAARGGEAVPVFVVDPYFFAPERAKELPSRMQYLVGSLAELAEGLAQLGSRLLLLGGNSVDVIPRVARAMKVDRVVAHRWSEPFGRERDRRVAEALGAVPFELFEGETLASHGQVLTQAGKPFSVFSPFGRALAKTVVPGAPIGRPRALPPIPESALTKDVRALEVPLPTLASIGVTENPRLVAPGETAARKRVGAFLRGAAARYEVGRNELGVDGTSRLSQDLKFGTVSVRSVWHAAKDALAEHPQAWSTFSNELVWRDFAYHVLHFQPSVLETPFRREWAGFAWRKDPEGWAAWTEGKTGYPVVDASARQLLAEGFVHNRARMISASFLCKHLMVDFRLGEAHYLKWLTDGDWAANDLGWQWSAGCGVDAQPWFRVFNPVSQGEKFDPDGAYVRRWVPELARVPAKWIHQPWGAPAVELDRAGVRLGRDYPRPIVDHALARGRFLAAAEELTSKAKGP
jgi:deoxyribodipyrimidine photo-lyase